MAGDPTRQVPALEAHVLPYVEPMAADALCRKRLTEPVNHRAPACPIERASPDVDLWILGNRPSRFGPSTAAMIVRMDVDQEARTDRGDAVKLGSQLPVEVFVDGE